MTGAVTVVLAVGFSSLSLSLGAWNRPELARLCGRLSSRLRTIGLAVRLTALLAGRLLVRADNKAVNSGAGVVELEAAGTVGGAVVRVGGEVGAGEEAACLLRISASCPVRLTAVTLPGNCLVQLFICSEVAANV